MKWESSSTRTTQKYKTLQWHNHNLKEEKSAHSIIIITNIIYLSCNRNKHRMSHNGSPYNTIYALCSVLLGNRCVCICVCHQNRDCRQSSRPFKQPQFTFVPFSFQTHWILFFSMSDHRMLNSTCVLLLLSCRSTVPCLFLQFLALHTSYSFVRSFFLAYVSFVPFSSLLFSTIVHDQMLLFAHSMLFCTQFCRLVSF